MDSEAAQSQTQKDVAVSKEELERLKLEIEIKKLKDPWWKNPAYILAALPTLLAVLTVAYGFANGYFQATATKLENQKHDLQIEKDKLEADIKEFTEKRDNLSRWNAALIDEIQKKEQTLKQRDAEHEFFQGIVKEAKKLGEENKNLKAEIENLRQNRNPYP
jgi:hypothetical protein